MERVTRIELALSAWKAEVPPQHFTRVMHTNDSGAALSPRDALTAPAI